ncbi:MAG TPA: S8 family serine peptidase [Pseudonocardiaceae bacterium]|jgi:subtilisin family serine protease|nr:S8 family serine peptidase [Pseudonocardiaceae bacterium]
MRARWVAAGIAAALLCAVPLPAAAAPGPPGHVEWWFDTWHVQHLWAEGARGQGIVIGEIDTGVAASLSTFSGHVLAGTDLGPGGGDGRRDRDVDPFGHGTAMASLMVAHDGPFGIVGLAPDARVLPVAVPISGTTDDATSDSNPDLAEAIRFAVGHGAKIISMSLGGSTDGDADHLSCPADEQAAIDDALSRGAIVVAAGGNSGDSGNPIEEPAVCLGVVSVGAVDSAGRVPPWSSRHPYLTVTAPGVNVPTVSRVAGTAFFGDGTSQAAAITSAGLAVIWSRYPKLTNRQVVARLLATLHGGRTTPSPATGYGSIDIGAAVDRQVPANAPDPVFAAVDPFLGRDREQVPPPPAPPIQQAPRLREPAAVPSVPPAGPFAAGAGLAGLVGAAVGLIALVGLGMLAIGGRRRSRGRVGGFSSSVHPDGPGSAR